MGTIEEAGIEGTVADPDHAATVLDAIAGVTHVFWLLGSVDEESAPILNGPRLERLLEKLVDSPVRGFVYEAAGTAAREHLATGAGIVREAGERWRIPVAVVDAEPADRAAWLDSMLAAATGAASAGSA